MKYRSIADLSAEALQIADVLADLEADYKHKGGEWTLVSNDQIAIKIEYSNKFLPKIKVVFGQGKAHTNLADVFTSVEMAYLFAISKYRRELETYSAKENKITRTRIAFGKSMAERFNIQQ